jgi:predicted DNA binding CopG/RHH family protein
MVDNKKFEDDAKDWDDKTLGASMEYVEPVSDEVMEQAMEALNLKMISIRLQQGMIQDMKFIAKANGIAYQQLIRRVLSAFVENEKKQIMQDELQNVLDEMKEAQARSENEPPPLAA